MGQKIKFYKSFTALKLGEIEKAIFLCPEIDNVPTEFSNFCCTALILKLEIALTEKRFSISTIETSDKFIAYFENLSSKIKISMAHKIKILFPLSSAFLSLLPISPVELKSVCGDLIIEISNRIIVFNQKIQPILAACATLNDFGFSYKKKLNEVQMRQEEDVFLKLVGSRLHMFRPVSPAFMILQLLRAHEEYVGSDHFKTDSYWRRIAIELSNSHGIIPHSKGFEIEKRQSIQKLVEDLLAGRLLPSSFFSVLSKNVTS